MRGPMEQGWISTRPFARRDLRCQRRGESGGGGGGGGGACRCFAVSKKSHQERESNVTVVHTLLLALAGLMPDDRCHCTSAARGTIDMRRHAIP
ncbi:hypothetical protein CGRA01v4_10605 [Colletotrichum graminicola]|nr:hypothetical protein CGRA01v4_10605 [Colletotrichum graminicola]